MKNTLYYTTEDFEVWAKKIGKVYTLFMTVLTCA